MRKKLRNSLFAFGLTCGVMLVGIGQGNGAETTAQPKARMAWWRDARFGMFIHWGIYAVPAHGEWYMTTGHVPIAQYEQYAGKFDPTNFDAATWVKIAKDAGMKYLVITSKHHDGFCMFNTKATDYNVVDDTPWHHDPLKDLSEQCRQQGVRFCVYYSIMDWHHPDQAPAQDNPQEPTYNPTKMRPGRKADYIRYMKTQLHELITQYHPGVIWFDGDWPDWWTVADGQELYAWLRQQDPELIINNRVGKRVKGAGDYGTPEQHIPATGLQDDWETCMTINNNWGYNAADHDFKSTQTLLHNLVDIVSKGGNYLLNVGPTAKGVIPSPEVERLEAMGRWLKVNGAAIYGTTASPFRLLPWGRCTKKISGNDTTLYLEVFEWPDTGQLLVPGLTNAVLSASLLATGQSLKSTASEDGVNVAMPLAAPDPICSVVVLHIKGTPGMVPGWVSQQADGSLKLEPAYADLHGDVQVETRYSRPDIGFWTNPQDWVEWPVRITRPGTFTVTAEVAAPASSSLEIKAGDQTLKASVSATGDYSQFKKVNWGNLSISRAGTVRDCFKNDHG
jgi:alpha-L-fucosidase